MLQVKLSDAPRREQGSNEVTFRILDETDVQLVKSLESYQNIKVGDLCVILEEDGYTKIAEMFAERHDPSNKHGKGTLIELAELYEHLFGNSDWEWIPNDGDSGDISDGYHMYVDDHGDIRVLTGFWSDANSWRDDPLETLITKGYLIYTYHAQSEFSDDMFFDLPEGAQAAWERGDYTTFSDLMDAEMHEKSEAQLRAIRIDSVAERLQHE